MDFITTLDITMAAVLLVIIICSRVFVSYKNRLKHMLLTRVNCDEVLAKVENSIHKESLEQAQEDYKWYDCVWLPLCYTSVGLTIGLWMSMSFHLIERNDFMLLLPVAFISAIVTRAFLFNHRPKWLGLWTLDVFLILTEHEKDMIIQRVSQIQQRIDELTESDGDDSHNFTPNEALEMYQLLIEQKVLVNRLEQIQNDLTDASVQIEGD